MTWEQVLTLLHIAHMANEYGGLSGLRDAAINRLREADVGSLTFSNEATDTEDEE